MELTSKCNERKNVGCDIYSVTLSLHILLVYPKWYILTSGNDVNLLFWLITLYKSSLFIYDIILSKQSYPDFFII